MTKRFTWLKKDVYAPQIVITDSLTEKDLTPTDCYELLNGLWEENEQLKQFKDKTFNLLDKEITKNEEAMEVFVKKGADIGAMGFHTNMLKILRKGLQE